MALGQLVNGQWTKNGRNATKAGSFNECRLNFVIKLLLMGQAVSRKPGRYHLYISLGCPWAHHTALLWKLKGLEEVVGLSIVDSVISDQGAFSDKHGCILDTVNGADYLWQIHIKADPTYTGRVTVPVLWDQTHTIVNNESRQIIRMLNSEFNALAKLVVDFYPEHCTPRSNKRKMPSISRLTMVYRSGFAASQSAYEQAVTELFEALDHWETILNQQRYLCGDQITLADWCMFTTLFRFDLAYYGLFKCLKRLVDYPNLWNSGICTSNLGEADVQCRSREAVAACQNLIPTAWFQSDPILILICRMIAIAFPKQLNQAAA